jgi:hypothetical protein
VIGIRQSDLSAVVEIRNWKLESFEFAIVDQAIGCSCRYNSPFSGFKVQKKELTSQIFIFLLQGL